MYNLEMALQCIKFVSELQMFRNTYRLFSIFAPYFIISTFLYFIVCKKITLTKIEIICFSLSLFNILLIFPFLLIFTTKFNIQSQQNLRSINVHLHIGFRISSFVTSILISIFSYAVIFYEYQSKMSLEGGLWAIEISIFVSLISYILYSKTITLGLTNVIFTYIIYIIFLILIILFLAHFSIMTREVIYEPEFILQIVILTILLDCWWTQTPTSLRMVMILVDIVAFEEFLRRLILKQQIVALRVYHFIIILLICVHLISKIIQLVQQIQKCRSQFLDDTNKDIPLSTLSISKIPMIQFQNFKQNSNWKKTLDIKSNKQENEISVEDIVQVDGLCAICTMKIQLDSFIYQIQCYHTFHAQCLGEWLQFRNSCPTCRKPAV